MHLTPRGLRSGTFSFDCDKCNTKPSPFGKLFLEIANLKMPDGFHVVKGHHDFPRCTLSTPSLLGCSSLLLSYICPYARR
jgi:hypothetical protein|mmetsp:Transcript_81338/g.136132  ORF Transcript_81338/g.136132 Transcript_81338/m.136132 type:complete len:80 (+) Transcript_81338:1155-1394(+)